MVLAYLAALIPGLLMAITQPVWSRIDEAQHTDFIVQLSSGVYPVVDRTTLAPQTLDLVEATGVYRGLPKGTYPVPDVADIGPPPDGLSAAANAAWMKRHLWQLSFEAAQTPGYYVLMTVPWWVADRVAGPLRAVYVLRIINALLIALLAPMAVYVSSRLWAGRNEVTALAALFAILLPGLALNLTRVSNDSLAAVLGGLLVVLCVRWVGGPWRWRQAAVLGAVLGAALLVKLTLIGLAPAAALAMLWPAGGATLVKRMSRIVVFGLVALICLAPWLWINWQLYGGLTPGAHAARLADALPSGFAAVFVPFDIAVFDLSYWAGEPVGILPLTVPFAILGGLVFLLALAAVLRFARRPSKELDSSRMWVATVAAGGLTALSLLLPAAAGFQFAGPGRYAYPALPAVAALCAIGVHRVLSVRWLRLGVVVAYAAIAATMLGVGATGMASPDQAGSGAPPPSARLVPVQAASQWAGFSIQADRVALDAVGHVTWVEISATNTRGTAVEWGVVPVASADGLSARGDYAKSTHMAGDIDPGEKVSGWLYLPLDPARWPAGGSLQLRFEDVALDGYRTVGDMDMHVQLAGA